MRYLGKVTSPDDSFPVCLHPIVLIAPSLTSLPGIPTQQKTYVCTSDAARAGFCSSSELGSFILDLPQGMSLSDTSFWSAKVSLKSNSMSTDSEVASSGLWDNPEGNPSLPPDNYTSPWLPRGAAVAFAYVSTS